MIEYTYNMDPMQVVHQMMVAQTHFVWRWPEGYEPPDWNPKKPALACTKSDWIIWDPKEGIWRTAKINALMADPTEMRHLLNAMKCRDVDGLATLETETKLTPDPFPPAHYGDF